MTILSPSQGRKGSHAARRRHASGLAPHLAGHFIEADGRFTVSASAHLSLTAPKEYING